MLYIWLTDGRQAHFSYAALHGLAAGLRVGMDLLIIGDEAIPKIKEPVNFSGVWIASLQDLMMMMKGRAFVMDRDKSEQDFRDFEWVLKEIKARRVRWCALELLELVFVNRHRSFLAIRQ